MGKGGRGLPVGVRFHQTPRAFAASLGEQASPWASRSRHHGFLREKLRLPTVAPFPCVIFDSGSRASQLVPPRPAEIEEAQGRKKHPPPWAIWGWPGTASRKRETGDKPFRPTPSAYSNVPCICWRVPQFPPDSPPLGARANTANTRTHAHTHTEQGPHLSASFRMAPPPAFWLSERTPTCALPTPCPLRGSCIFGLQGLWFSSRR